METDVRFTHDEKPWRCIAFDRMEADFPGITAEDLQPFAAHLARDKDKWRIAIRLYGLQPVFTFSSDPDDLKLWSPQTIGPALGMNQASVRDMIKRIKGGWGYIKSAKMRQQSAEPAQAPEAEAAPTPEAQPETPTEAPIAKPSPAPLIPVDVEDEFNLRADGFPTTLFTEIKGHDGSRRPAGVIRDEMQWFAGRVADMRRPLQDQMAKALTRDILLNELQIYRLQAIVAQYSPGQMEHQRFMALLEKAQGRYLTQIAQLNEIAPWASRTEQKLGLRGSISDLIRAHQEYYGRRDAAFIDGMFTATEIQVLMRTPLQAPHTQYYPDIVIAVAQARAHLFDPTYNPREFFRDKDWKRLCAGWEAAEKATRDDESVRGEHKTPDLLATGPEGEYEALYVPDVAPAEEKLDEP